MNEQVKLLDKKPPLGRVLPLRRKPPAGSRRAEVPGAKIVGDITSIPTWQGWAFLATVIDCATRKCVGWTIDDNYRTPLITSAIQMAAQCRASR
jgi:transposase InsO family protein